jgi:hypothetical protein
MESNVSENLVNYLELKLLENIKFRGYISSKLYTHSKLSQSERWGKTLKAIEALLLNVTMKAWYLWPVK